MFYNYLNTLFRHSYLLVCVLFLWGCSSDAPVPGLPEEDTDEVIVTFSAGNILTPTRVAFPDETPVKIYIYQQTAGVSDFSVAPYKTVEGKTSGTEEGLSKVTLTGGNVVDSGSDKVLTVRGGKKYDFVVVVNGTPKATIASIGTPSAGVMSGFAHGMDILASRQSVDVNYGSTVNVTFNGAGTDGAGNLPHLGSAVCVEGRVTESLFNFVTAGDNTFNYGVAGIDFKQCLPRNANLPFAGSPMAMNVQASGYNTSYSANLPVTAEVITSASQVITSADGYLLPCPLRDALLSYNTMNIDFRMRVNGGEVVFQASGVQTPPFKPGFRYRFIVELDYDPADPDNPGVVNLYLSIEPWSSLFWQSGMGEDDETNNLLLISLGSWSSVSWQSGMGADNTASKVITAVAGWRSVTWNSQMGEPATP